MSLNLEEIEKEIKILCQCVANNNGINGDEIAKLDFLINVYLQESGYFVQSNYEDENQ
jgi:hypothetical protein